jgi:methyl-accepting chemotaxis protein
MGLKIGTKIKLGFLMVILLMLIIGVYCLQGLGTIRHLDSQIIYNRFPSIIESQDLQISSQEKVFAVRGYLLSGNEKFLGDYQVYKEEVKKVLESFSQTGKDKEIVQSFMKLSQEYDEIADKAFSFKRARMT